MIKPRARQAATIFWHLLFFDMFFMSLRFGGVSVVSAAIHGALLGTAGLTLCFGMRLRPVPRLFRWIFGLVLTVLFIQLVPLPDGWFPILAPVKHRIVESIAALYPQIQWSSAAAMMPQHHLLRASMLALDLLTVFLLVTAPAPDRKILPFWACLTGFAVGIPKVLTRIGVIGDDLIRFWPTDTFGGVVNDNHYATLAVICILLTAFYAYQGYRCKQWYLSGAAVLSFLCVAAGFSQAWSRSGLVNLGIGAVTWIGVLFFTRSHKPRPLYMFASALALVVILGLFFTVSSSGAKMREQGVEFADRIAYNKAGLSYLAEGQVLGTGLGSVITLIEPITDKRLNDLTQVHHLHNEYMQIILELGLPGLVAFVLFLLLALSPLTGALINPSEEPQEHVFLCMVTAVVAVTAAHSLIDFPLRILSIRLLVLLVVFYALAPYRPPALVLSFRPLVAPALIYLASMGYLIDYINRIPPGQAERGSETYALLYGRPFEPTAALTSAKLDRLIWEPVPFSEAHGELAHIRELLHASFYEWPFNMRALNQLFMTELIQYEINLRGLALLNIRHGLYPETEPTDLYSGAYDSIREKAAAIRTLGKDAGYNSKFPLFFLLDLHRDQLNDEDLALWKSWGRQTWLRQYEGITPKHGSDR
ncbi:MAG: O-antigen ligase family protein [Acidobacteriota bacterium]|nr:O-antigen ligase family protein [Acidobacteriota bacterium]